MGFDINGTTLTSSSGLTANYDGTRYMKMGPTGVLQRYNGGQPMFRASGAYQAGPWIGIGTNVWTLVPGFNITDVNVASCYNATYTRFTVPVDGVYLIAAHCYLLINTAGGYSHPMFWVNGAANLRRASSGALHRIRGHGLATGYSTDNEICELIPMLAGDYVDFRCYCAGDVYHIPHQGRFEGYLLF